MRTPEVVMTKATALATATYCALNCAGKTTQPGGPTLHDIAVAATRIAPAFDVADPSDAVQMIDDAVSQLIKRHNWCDQKVVVINSAARERCVRRQKWRQGRKHELA